MLFSQKNTVIKLPIIAVMLKKSNNFLTSTTKGIIKNNKAILITLLKLSFRGMYDTTSNIKGTLNI